MRANQSAPLIGDLLFFGIKEYNIETQCRLNQHDNINNGIITTYFQGIHCIYVCKCNISDCFNPAFKPCPHVPKHVFRENLHPNASAKTHHTGCSSDSRPIGGAAIQQKWGRRYGTWSTLPGIENSLKKWAENYTDLVGVT